MMPVHHFRNRTRSSSARSARRAVLLVLIPLVMGLAVGSTVGLAPARGDDDPTGDPAAGNATAARQRLARQLGQQIRAGDLTAARATVLVYLDQFPYDGAMHYNLACLETRLGDREAARLALRNAFDHGFTDLQKMQTDPDLAALRGSETFAGWLAQCRVELARRARTRGIFLRDGYWSQTYQLAPDSPSQDDQAGPDVLVSWLATAQGLSIQTEVQAAEPVASRALPDQGTFLVNLVAPADEPDAYASNRFFTFAFGLDGAEPHGVYRARHGHRLQQRVVELDPRIRLHGDGRSTWSLHIPWRSIEPYAPPLDSLLGVNISFFTRNGDSADRSVSLIADPHVDSVQVPWRRYVPLRVAPSDRTEHWLTGRVATTIVREDPVALTLVVWSATQGQGILKISVLNDEAAPVATGGDKTITVSLQPGTQQWQQEITLSTLPTGSYRVVASLTIADNDSLVWQANLLHLREDWDTGLQERQRLVRDEERPSLTIRLDAVRQALAHHHRWDDPAAIGTTLAELGTLIQTAERTGSILEPAGTTLVAVDGGGGRLWTALVTLPADAADHPSRKVLLVFPDLAGDETQLASSLASALTGRDAPVLVVPLVPAEAKRRADNALVIGQAVQAWARKRFAVSTTLVAGTGHGAADALHHSLRNPDACQAVLMLVDDHFVPWPGRNPDQLEKTLVTLRNDTPLTFARLSGDTAGTGQAAPLIAALQAAGFTVRDDLAITPALTSSAAASVADWLASTQGQRY